MQPDLTWWGFKPVKHNIKWKTVCLKQTTLQLYTEKCDNQNQRKNP